MTKWEFFKSGWRPMLGWLSLVIVFSAFIVHPFLLWVVALFFPGIVPPVLDSTAILNVIALIIGVGTMRTIEKLKGIPDKYDSNNTPKRPNLKD